MKVLTVYVNDQPVFEYDRETTLEERQLKFLDKMDSDMDRGVRIQGKLLSEPDKKQRATFVAMNLIKALQQDNQAIISASCAYLVDRNPALVEIHANDQEGRVDMQLVEEH